MKSKARLGTVYLGLLWTVTNIHHQHKQTSYLHVADIEVFVWVASSQIAADVDIIVFDDASDDICCRNALCSLCWKKPVTGKEGHPGLEFVQFLCWR